VLDSEGTLQADCHLPVIGDCRIYSRILGNSEKLNEVLCISCWIIL
jgi:hypothetical protein